MDKMPITEEGYKNLENELDDLKRKRRPAVVKEIAEARKHGDLSENAEYHAARDKQSFIEGRVMDLETAVVRSEIIDTSKLQGDKIIFGAYVTLLDEESDEKKKYRIVGEYEADIDKDLLSISAPIARMLIGKSEGDIVEVETPSGIRSYEVLEVEFK